MMWMHLMTGLLLTYINLGSGQNVSLQAFDIQQNSAIPSPGSIMEGSLIKLKCTFPFRPNAISIATGFHTKSFSSEEEWTGQIICLYAHGNASTSRLATSTDIFNRDNLTCNTSHMDLHLKIYITLPKHYRCLWEDHLKVIDRESEITLRTYVTPTVPQITNSGTPTESTQVTYTCKSTARPPPKLRFSYGVTISASELSHTPALSTINVDQPAGKSILKWTTTATRSMNKKQLKCTVYEHLSNSDPPIEDSVQMVVFFGPENLPDRTVVWNVNITKTLTLACVFDFHGNMNYEWFNNSEVSENRLAETQNITLSQSDFTHETVGSSFITTYICRGSNRDNNDKSAQLRISLKAAFTEKDIVPTTDPAVKSPDPLGVEEPLDSHSSRHGCGAIIMMPVMHTLTKMFTVY